MVAAPFKTSDVVEGAGEAGYLLGELLTRLAEQVGKPAPDTAQGALAFFEGPAARLQHARGGGAQRARLARRGGTNS